MKTVIIKEPIMCDANRDVISRNTKQKAMILSCIKENIHRHITVDDVYDLLKDNNNQVGKATIYRYLSQLEKEDCVKKYSFMNKKGACFRYLEEKSKCKEHYHLMCDICGIVMHFENNELQKALNIIQSNHNFEINDTKTVFYGMCRSCNNEK